MEVAVVLSLEKVSTLLQIIMLSIMFKKLQSEMVKVKLEMQMLLIFQKNLI